MPLDPISYSLIKRKLSSSSLSSNSASSSSSSQPSDSNSVNIVYSTTEPSNKDVIWFDLNHNRPRLYNAKSGKWGMLFYAEGYTDFDNNLDGFWTNYINIPITTLPTESVQYKIEIDGNTIRVYANDGATILTFTSAGTYFWNSVQPDGSDIRVFDETYMQKYFWIETFDYTAQKMVMWTKIDAGQEQVNIAFGNNLCTISSYHDGNMTFEFFDDFSDGNLDGWKILNDGGTGTASVVQFDGKYMAKLSPAGWDNMVAIAYPFAVSDSGYVIEARAITDETTECGFSLCFSDGTIKSRYNSDVQNGYMFVFGAWLNTRMLIWKSSSYSSSALAYVDGKLNPNTYYIASGLWHGSVLDLYLDYKKVLSAEDTTFSSLDHIQISTYYTNWYFDWLRVRKYLPTNLSFDRPTIKEF